MPRFLKNYNDDPYGKQRWLAWGIAVFLLLALFQNIWQNPSWPYILFGGFIGFLFYSIARPPFSQDTKQRIQKMQETRVTESYCQFSSEFRSQAVDGVILKAVLAQLAEYLPANFPIRSEDDLVKDYGLTKNNIRELKLYLSDITGRSLLGENENLYYNKAPTVYNLILFFDYQPFSLSKTYH